ncbi:PREDICTED: uncharacterized protein LOC105367861 [Ceratosolen solmsi marchali]|uniref:Uncharacterized protein LOC105367861 n=1 Tax=Ceratosolen solmsi marchali TaxID=326594 RepID=A0AAJ6YV93_9HYME|nr:PREDICTED: uncharacterized protein LOC105367861 [Ceratosolen solmsi marchali]
MDGDFDDERPDHHRAVIPSFKGDVPPICNKRTGRSKLFIREHTFLRREPAMVTCPNCLRGVETIVERRNTSTTHLSALLLLPVCLCALPYYSKLLRDAIHSCPSCGIHLGSNFASSREALAACFSQRQGDENFSCNKEKEKFL